MNEWMKMKTYLVRHTVVVRTLMSFNPPHGPNVPEGLGYHSKYLHSLQSSYISNMNRLKEVLPWPFPFVQALLTVQIFRYRVHISLETDIKSDSHFIWKIFNLKIAPFLLVPVARSGMWSWTTPTAPWSRWRPWDPMSCLVGAWRTALSSHCWRTTRDAWMNACSKLPQSEWEFSGGTSTFTNTVTS